MKTKKKAESVTVDLDLGDLKPTVQKLAKACGVTPNEFICNAIESAISSRHHRERDDFVRHGGKHLMGKSAGYEVTKDGRYYPAPTYTQLFDELFAERSSIHSMANSIVAQLQERLIQVEKEIIKAKVRLIEDIGLDTTRNWTYYGGDKNYLQELAPEGQEQEGR